MAVHTCFVKLDPCSLGISCAILIECPVVPCISQKGISLDFPHICSFPGICNYLPSSKILLQFDAFDFLSKLNLFLVLYMFFTFLHDYILLYCPNTPCLLFPNLSVYCTVQYQSLLVLTIIPSYLIGASFQL